jgi:hypothetical protein
LVLNQTGGMPLEVVDKAPQVTDVTVSGSASTHPDFQFAAVDGSGEQLRSVPLAGLDTISITFSEEVFVVNTDLVLTNMQGATLPALSLFTYDLSTHTASWTYSSPLPKGQYLLDLSDGIVDLDHESLDGEFTNPWSLNEAAGFASTLPSGDGEAGGDFRFRFTNLQADYNGDNVVDAADYTVWGNNNGLTGATSTRQGDGNGDGLVNSADYGLWSSQYSTNYVRWPSIEPGTILVSTTVDENDANHAYGDLSLREALAIAAANTGHDRIEFDPAVFSIAQTIQIDIGNGHFNINSDVTIAGPGVDLLTISGDMLYRVFNVSSGVTASLENLTITDGWVSSGNSGGGIYTAGNLTLDSVVVAGNYAGSNGGGIYVASTGSLALIDSTVDSNTATFGGGIFGHFGSGERLKISGSTISNNTLLTNGTGAGLNFYSVASGTAAVAKIVNSTFSGNTGTASGGIRVRYLADVSIINSTIAGNTAGSGAGLHLVNNPTVTLHNTIVADNKTSGGTDSNILGTLNSTSSHNLVGPGGSGGLVNSTNGNIVLSTGQSAGLSELADYGGPTKTHTLLVGSPAIDAGDPTKALDFAGDTLIADQRGRSRVVYAVDIGAVEREILGDYNGDGSVDAADYTVWRNDLDSTTRLVADGDGNGKVDQNDYNLWKAHYGNTVGPNLSAQYGIYVVSSGVDESDTNFTRGDLSLREALDLAEVSTGTDQIVFRHELAGQSITASLGELVVDSDVDLVGLGADQLTISGTSSSRVFNVASSTSASIRNVRVANGYVSSGSGGAITSTGNLTLDGVAIEDNYSLMGGGIYTSGGSLTVKNSTIADNEGYYIGGGVYTNGTNVSFVNVTLSTNQTSYAGGGLYATGGSLSIAHSTVTQNRVIGSTSGGGIYVSTSGAQINHSIVADNFTGTGTTENDISGSFSTSLSGYNLIGTGGSGGLTHGSNGNLVGVANYGGRTRTHALLVGSDAIDAGIVSFGGSPSTDQRGKSRVADGDDDLDLRIDIGAFELAADEYFGTI